MRSILVIEDNAFIRENTTEFLTLWNYEVMTAENGRAGVEMACEKKPDLIISDIRMPVLDGFGVLQALRSDPETAHIPLIFLSSCSDPHEIRLGIELGAADYLCKPFDEARLRRSVETQMSRIGA